MFIRLKPDKKKKKMANKSYSVKSIHPFSESGRDEWIECYSLLKV